MFSFKEPFNASSVLEGPYRSLGRFDLFAFHSVWNYSEMRKVLPGAVYVTLLRDPVDAFESNYVYMGLEKANKMDINGYAAKKVKPSMPSRPQNAIIGKNQLLWDLGTTPREMEDRGAVEEKIRRLDRQFDLVMVAERFEESLVLLQDLLCWPTEELAFLRQNERLRRSNVTAETRATLREWLWADYLLYDHFSRRLEERVASFGRDGGGSARMSSRTAELRARNALLERDCVVAKGSNRILKGEFRMAVDIVSGYVVDAGRRPWCAPYARSEPNFARRLRDWQAMRVSERTLRGLDGGVE